MGSPPSTSQVSLSISGQKSDRAYDMQKEFPRYVKHACNTSCKSDFNIMHSVIGPSPVHMARMTLSIKLDGNRHSFISKQIRRNSGFHLEKVRAMLERTGEILAVV